jgi:E1A-binding protein p400
MQALAILLRRLKREGHRALIFTQMTKMLDVFEVFLNLHGHTYLRLDGTTKVERRQQMMEWFNSDPKVITELIFYFFVVVYVF